MSQINATAADEAVTSVPPPRGSSAFLAAEASGAFAATFVALPQALSLGVLAFAALGPQYAGAGVVAALMASVVGNVFAAGTNAVRCQIVGARSSTTALIAGSVAVLAAHPGLNSPAGLDVPTLLGLVFAAVALSGVLQLLFGLAGLGRAIKYVPYPVIAGFMNGVAILILLSQLRAVLGLDGHQPLATTFGELGEARWGSVATALASLATIVLLPRHARRVPPLVGGLVAGILVHYAIEAVSPASVGAVVGPLPAFVPTLDDARAMGAALAAVDSALLWQVLLPNAILLAVVGALDGLLAAVVCDGVTRGRHDSNRALVGHGLGNLVGGLLGALPAQCNAHTPIANFHAGGRTSLATLLHAAFALAVLVAIGWAVAAIPIAALAGIMLFIAYSLMDRWTGDLVRRMRGGSQERTEVGVNVAIVLAVAVAQVAMNVMIALAIGIAASVALLLVKLSGSPVRRHLDGTIRSSHKVRGPAAREALRVLAPRIRIMELQGEIFFGTADSLQADVEAFPDGVYVILDFRRVHQIDASGARVLGVIGHRAARRGIEVALADVRLDEARGRYLRALGIDAAVPTHKWFADLDRALEWAEDQLLEQSRFEETGAELPPAAMALFEGLSPAEVERIQGMLERSELADGDPVFLEGEEGDRLYLIAQGAVSIKAKLRDEVRARRLATFTPGVMFGEMALLEGTRRSADAYAKGERVVLYSLGAERFEQLVREEPALGAHLHRNICRQLTTRLRDTTEALRALE